MTDVDISIVTPVFNTGLIFKETITSLLEQAEWKGKELPSFEWVVVDDHSTDEDTMRILADMTNLNVAVTLVSNIYSKGVAGARNTGIEVAKGRWIAFLDSDDLWSNDALSRKWDYIKNNPVSAWISSSFDVVDDDSSLVESELSISSPLFYKEVSNNYEQGKASVLARPVRILSRNCFIATSSVLVTKDLLDRVGCFNESLECAEDYELWFRLALITDHHYLAFNSSKYRVRRGSLTHCGRSSSYCEDDMLLGLLDKSEFHGVKNLLYSRLYTVMLDECYFYEKNDEVKKYLFCSLKFVRLFFLRIKPWLLVVSALLKCGMSIKRIF